MEEIAAVLVQKEQPGALAALRHRDDPLTPESNSVLQTALSISCAHTTVTRHLPTLRHRRGLVSLSPSAISLVCEEIDNIVHTLQYIFRQDLRRSHIHPPSSHHYAISRVHVRRLPGTSGLWGPMGGPLSRVIRSVTLCSFVVVLFYSMCCFHN